MGTDTPTAMSQLDGHTVKRIGRAVLDTRPKVSIVIPAYNSAKYIKEALDSVFHQQFREFEVVLVNDGSPETADLERAIETRLEEIVYICQTNAGAGAARNTAIQHARGELIAFLDADDIWLPDHLASQVAFLETGGYDMVYCDAQIFGESVANGRTFMKEAPSAGEATFESLLDLRCNVITSGTVARKSTIAKAGMFETERVRAHDFHLWLRMAKAGAKIGYQRKQLVKYREHVDSLSGDAVSRAERELDAFIRVRSTIDLSPQQMSIVEKRIAGLKADLAVELGKAELVTGNYPRAVAEFAKANRQRRSVKLALVTIASKFFPRLLARLYQSNRAPAPIGRS